MATKVPSYSYTGSHYAVMQNGYWYIYLLSVGTHTFTMTYAKSGVEVFLVGGGGGGGGGWTHGADGGGGGYTTTGRNISINAGQAYPITIGAGGAGGAGGGGQAAGSTIGGTGGTSSAFGYSASGGIGGWEYGGNPAYFVPSAGGSGGGAGAGGAGGSNGSNGGNGNKGGTAVAGGKGQGTTTREFGESSRTLYSGGGGGNGAAGGAGGGGSGGVSGSANTGGGGGGGGLNGYGGNGGSGIVVIRGTQDDNIPVFFNGTQLTKIIFNGTTLTGLIKDGTRIFAKYIRKGAMKCVTSISTAMRLTALI